MSAPATRQPSVSQILESLDRRPVDDHAVAALGSCPVRRAAPLGESGPEDFTFCTATVADPQRSLARVRARVLLVDDALAETAVELASARVPVIVATATPRRDFAHVLRALFAPQRPQGIHPTAVVADDAEIGSRVFIGPLATVGPGVQIGDDTVIHAGVHIYGQTRIGRSVTIHGGTVIGAPGYGYERAPDGTLEPFPQLGEVEIGDEVEIGANTCIDRGALGATRIGARTRIDNLVNIAHNVEVGSDCAIVAHAMLCGGTQIGDRAWIAPCASIREQAEVGESSIVGLGAVVLASVPPGSTVVGNPARAIGHSKATARAPAQLARDHTDTDS